jgi:hypothetical protein
VREAEGGNSERNSFCGMTISVSERMPEVRMRAVLNETPAQRSHVGLR